MDPYAAAQTYPPPSSTQIQPQPQPQPQPQNQDQYLYNQQYDQSQQYPYYPQPQIAQQQQYPNPNPNAVYPQHPEQEPAAIHPPGVPVQNDPNQIAAYQQAYGQTQYQTDPNAYYAQQQQQTQQLAYSDPAIVPQAQQQWPQQGETGGYGLTSLYPTNGQPQYNPSGRGGGRGFRGRGSSFRGRGRGRGRGGKTSIGQPSKPPCMAWCELCRVDCNTLEILENHKNGKKHIKNLKVQQELQKLAAKTQETQMAAIEKQENPVPEAEEQANGLKRKISDGARNSAEPVKKQKEIVPFICELCNVKCESAPTFDSHLKGKKHIFNLRTFQEQQATLGQAALQALYPALEALYPALLQAISSANGDASTSSANGGLDQQVLQWLQAYLPQTGQTGLTGPLVGGPGPEPAPVQALGPTGPNHGGTQEGPVNEVKTEPKAEDEGEQKTKVEEGDSTSVMKVEPKSESKNAEAKE